jgi:NAD(P)-dependent dehydrogenase (short-subunit alcohol dehydrogenase family)
LRGVALVTRAVLPEMIARGAGRVINVASDIAERATPRNLAYASSKAAVIRFTENLAMAARPHGVFVFAVSPGLVRTRLTEASWQSMLASGVEGTPHPGGLVASDWSSPELVARLVLELASNVADDLTGRYIHARKDDLAKMLARIDEIRAQSLYTLKIRKLSDSSDG